MKIQSSTYTNRPAPAQMNNTVWTNWPSSEGAGRQLLPATWNGYWNMGAVLLLTQLKAVKK